jgi:hypothetical protein
VSVVGWGGAAVVGVVGGVGVGAAAARVVDVVVHEKAVVAAESGAVSACVVHEGIVVVAVACVEGESCDVANAFAVVVVVGVRVVGGIVVGTAFVVAAVVVVVGFVVGVAEFVVGGMGVAVEIGYL